QYPLTCCHRRAAATISHPVVTAILTALPRACFSFNHTPPTQIYTLSLHDALPIYASLPSCAMMSSVMPSLKYSFSGSGERVLQRDRKSTRLNSSHQIISYAVFCLK